jgi:hypothetical protein
MFSYNKFDDDYQLAITRSKLDEKKREKIKV